MVGGAGGVQGSTVAAAPAAASPAQAGVSEVGEEAVDVLKRALEMLRTEAAAPAAASTAGVEAARAEVSSAVGIDRREEEVKEQTARVLDALSEAYARHRRWEQARCAAVRLGLRSRMH